MKEISIAKLHRLFLSSAGVSIDTRKIQYGEIFFCLKGDNFNANLFAKKALEAGAMYTIIDEAEFYIDERTILVSDVLETLQFLASFHRRQFDIPFIGITGTNGKTTTKELLNAVLSKHYKTYATEGNFNNHIGVPLTILSIPNDTDIAIIEMGANHPGEITELCKIAEPNYGIITSIGKAHLEGFGSLQGVINTKKELYERVDMCAGKVFVNADNPLLMDLSKDLNRITYGQNDGAETLAKSVLGSPFATLDWNGTIIKSQLVGAYNFDNMLAAICIAEYFRLDVNQIVSAIEEYEPKNKRSQWQTTDKNELIIDAYNANPSSMEAALNSFNTINSDNKWLILGDMLELGADSEKEHQNIITLLDQFPKDRLILVGPEFVKAANSKEFNLFINTAEAALWIETNPIEKATILIKGSRGIALENLINLL